MMKLQSCSDIGRVLVLSDPPGRASRGLDGAPRGVYSHDVLANTGMGFLSSTRSFLWLSVNTLSGIRGLVAVFQ